MNQLARFDAPAAGTCAEELQRRLREADPAVLLVRPRVLRRVIKGHRHVPGLGLQVPHAKSYVIDRPALLDLADWNDLDLAGETGLPDTLILLARPDARRVRHTPWPRLLLAYWRLLFHAAVHRALEQRKLSDAEVDQRSRQLGPVRFAEIRTVLRQENLLLPPGDDRSAYAEFAAFYLELRHFAPQQLRYFFPSEARPDLVDELLKADINAEKLLARCRPSGAPDPGDSSAGAGRQPPDAAKDRGTSAPRSPAQLAILRAKAERARAKGNLVRAALLETRAATRPQAVADLGRLADRLRAALQLGAAEDAKVCSALAALARPAAEGAWPVEARLLFDLQKVCTDHERAFYALDLVEWGLSLGRRPVKRLLPHQGLLLQLKHLRRAAGRLTSARLADEEKTYLGRLLAAAEHHGEQRLRARLRPLLHDALDEVGLRPADVPERVARRKLVEELLDRAVERGYLTFGDLRDALSGNDLKLADLSGPREFWRGDSLLRADRSLKVALDGIYRGGEFYLRWLQRLSSLAFGTRPGRFLTRYLALPFGGAFVILEGLGHPISFVTKLFWGRETHLVSLPSVLALGVFLLALLYWPAFRLQVVRGLQGLGRGLRRLFLSLAALGDLRPVRLVLDSRPVVFLRRYLLRPLLLGGTTSAVLLAAGQDGRASGLGGALAFLAGLALFNSRLGRDLEEAALDGLLRSWKRARRDLLPGLFRLVMGFFKHLLSGVERLLYAVDEWLRFKSGDSRLSLVVKPVVGLAWFCVTYVVRFTLVLFIEPQVNPIKHFPVVTVSHKLVLLLFVPPMAEFLAFALHKPVEEATALAITVGTLIPGVFGFLTWELKENWRLYRANRPATLRPAVVGHHGETVPRLLRPGFHSGTVPKLFAKLRRALRRGQEKAVRKHEGALHHVEESVRRFVEREFVALLHEARGWGRLPLAAGGVRLGLNRIAVELAGPGHDGRPLTLSFAEQAGWLVADVEEPGRLSDLPKAARHAFSAALTGLYHKAGVGLVSEEVAACFGPRPVRWDVTERGLVVGPPDGRAEVLYDLREGDVLVPRPLDGFAPKEFPPVEASRLLFAKRPMTWQAWVDEWGRDEDGAVVEVKQE